MQPSLPYLRYAFDHVSVFEQLLESSIRGSDPLFSAVPSGPEPESIDDLVPITLRATNGRFTLSMFGAASDEPYPMDRYEPQRGDIFVFKKGTVLVWQPCSIRGNALYINGQETKAEVHDPLSFLLYRNKDLFSSVNDVTLRADTNAFASTALSIARPRRVSSRLLN